MGFNSYEVQEHTIEHTRATEVRIVVTSGTGSLLVRGGGSVLCLHLVLVAPVQIYISRPNLDSFCAVLLVSASGSGGEISKSLRRDIKATLIPVLGSFPPPPRGKSTSFTPVQKTGLLNLDLSSLIEH